MKFVVHHHTGHPGEADHYDLMIDEGKTLATWRISPESMARLLAGATAGAARIANHRREYLTFEGPISCDRGMVKIMDTGECELIGDDGGVFVYWFEGKKIRGQLEIEPLRGDRWEITLTPGPQHA